MNNSWKITQLGNVAQIEMGQSPPGGSYNTSGDGMPLINGPTEFTKRYPFVKQFTNKPTKICEFGDILLCVRGSSTGRINISNGRFCIGRGVAAIRGIKEEAITEYLEQVLTYNIQKLLSKTTGSTFPNIDKKALKKIELFLPNKNDQEKIQEILSTWDKAIEVVEELIAKKKLLLRRTYQDLVGERLYTDSPKYVPLSQLFDRVRTKNSENNTNVLTISAQFGLVNQLDYFKKDVSGKSLLGYYLIQRGDFAYNRSYSNGYPLGAIKRLDNYQKGVVSSLYLCFRPKKMIESDFYLHFFEAGGLNDEIRKIAQEGARNHGLLNVSVSDFFAIQLPFPEIEDQKVIANQLNIASIEIDLLNKKLSLLRKQKNGLMQRLLTGKIKLN